MVFRNLYKLEGMMVVGTGNVRVSFDMVSPIGGRI